MPQASNSSYLTTLDKNHKKATKFLNFVTKQRKIVKTKRKGSQNPAANSHL